MAVLRVVIAPIAQMDQRHVATALVHHLLQVGLGLMPRTLATPLPARGRRAASAASWLPDVGPHLGLLARNLHPTRITHGGSNLTVDDCLLSHCLSGQTNHPHLGDYDRRLMPRVLHRSCHAAGMAQQAVATQRIALLTNVLSPNQSP
jgi:hypothetical protein